MNQSNDPTSDIPLAELVEEILNPSTLECLVSDLTTLTDIEQVIIKDREFQMASEEKVELAQAVDLLLEGKIRGLQVRYRWDDTDWFDTLLRAKDGVKLVRTKAPTLPSS